MAAAKKALVELLQGGKRHDWKATRAKAMGLVVQRTDPEILVRFFEKEALRKRNGHGYLDTSEKKWSGARDAVSRGLAEYLKDGVIKRFKTSRSDVVKLIRVPDVRGWICYRKETHEPEHNAIVNRRPRRDRRRVVRRKRGPDHAVVEAAPAGGTGIGQPAIRKPAADVPDGGPHERPGEGVPGSPTPSADGKR